MIRSAAFTLALLALGQVRCARADAFIYDQLSVLRFHVAQTEQTRALLLPLPREAWATALRIDVGDRKPAANQFLADFRKPGGFDRLADRYLMPSGKRFVLAV